MNIAFTICSINYLGQAITLGKSINDTNPETIFRIYLVDRILGRQAIIDKVPFELIEIEKIEIPDFEGMCNRYNIIELNTSVKPFIFSHIFANEPLVQNIIYFDPDIKAYNSFDELYLKLNDYNIVLTPHLLTPSDKHPYGQPEANYLSTGIFNLGFIAVKRSGETMRFLDWWKERLVDQGYCKHEWHLFYDQKWMNLAITFFDGVYIEKSFGYNMAGWNLHERILNNSNGKYFVNEIYPLVFYHFSGVKQDKVDEISLHTTYTFNDRPDLLNIVNQYRSNNELNGHSYFKTFECFFFLQGKTKTVPTNKYKKFLRKILKTIKKSFLIV